MKINWKVRIKNKTFWIAFIPALALVIQQVFKLFGIEIDTSKATEELINLINALFILLAIIGVVSDPTTKGISDSKQAMTYEKPKAKGEHEDA